MRDTTVATVCSQRRHLDLMEECRHKWFALQLESVWKHIHIRKEDDTYNIMTGQIYHGKNMPVQQNMVWYLLYIICNRNKQIV